MPVGKSFTLGGGPRKITLKVKFGPPLDLRQFYKLPSSKETFQKISDFIMDNIAKLLKTM